MDLGILTTGSYEHIVRAGYLDRRESVGLEPHDGKLPRCLRE
jgi:hypothetical protein